MSCTGSNFSPYRITGKERDTESGLDYFGARYYGSTMGRFLSPDEFPGGPVDVAGGDPTPPGPLPYADITNPQSLNKYSYTYNNPLRYIDPDGHEGDDASDFIAGIGKGIEKELTELNNLGNSLAAHLSNALMGRHEEPLQHPVPQAASGAEQKGMMAASVGLFFVPGGQEGGAIKLTSSIKSEAGLVRLAKEAGSNAAVQRELDSLAGKLAAGNFQAGKGTKAIQGLGGIFEMRGASGARLYFRQVGQRAFEIVAKSSKANQKQVINALKKLYGD